MNLARNLVAGSWDEGASGDHADSVDPANGKLVGEAVVGTAEVANQAIAAARDAFVEGRWSQDMRLRSRVLMAFASNLRERHDEITELLVRESGKIRKQAHHEIAAGINEAEYFAGLARSILGRTLESAPNTFSIFLREPAGVAGIIVPWNAPVTLLVRSLAPALAAGCTCVIKPAPQTPLVNAAVVECLDRIDELPAGVVNSVNENGIEVATALATNPEVDVISFTGSTRTGKIVMEKAAASVKRVSLELGGKSPAIVFPDADLDRAVAEISRAAIALNGQMCTCVSRVLLLPDIEAEMTERLMTALSSVRMGHGLEAGVELGPLIDKASQQRVLGLIERARDEADVLLEGVAGTGDLAAGSFVSPTVFKIQDTRGPLVQNEHFAPMISIESCTDETDAISRANATRYGLAASLYTRDLNRAMRVSRALKFGTVWLNCHNRLMAEAETGGYRESGMGRLHGPEALHDFLETKTVHLEAGLEPDSIPVTNPV